MAVYAIRRGDESNDRLQSRFKKQVQEGRFLKLRRERKVRRKPFTKRIQRLRALKREEFRTLRRKTQFYSHR